jgi:hypothetical protein
MDLNDCIFLGKHEDVQYTEMRSRCNRTKVGPDTVVRRRARQTGQDVHHAVAVYISAHHMVGTQALPEEPLGQGK